MWCLVVWSSGRSTITSRPRNQLPSSQEVESSAQETPPTTTTTTTRVKSAVAGRAGGRAGRWAVAGGVVVARALLLRWWLAPTCTLPGQEQWLCGWLAGDGAGCVTGQPYRQTTQKSAQERRTRSQCGGGCWLGGGACWLGGALRRTRSSAQTRG